MVRERQADEWQRLEAYRQQLDARDRALSEGERKLYEDKIQLLNDQGDLETDKTELGRCVERLKRRERKLKAKEAKFVETANTVLQRIRQMTREQLERLEDINKTQIYTTLDARMLEVDWSDLMGDEDIL